MYGLPLILAMGLAWSGAQEAPVLHPEADAFRAGDKAYIVAPARPVGNFDYVISASQSGSYNEWLLVNHRRRTEQDSSPWLTKDSPAPEPSFYNVRLHQVRPFPPELRGKAGQWRLQSAQFDIVVLELNSMPNQEGQMRNLESWVVNCRTGRTMQLPVNASARVLSEDWFLYIDDAGTRFLNWNGESRPMNLDLSQFLPMYSKDPYEILFRHRNDAQSNEWYALSGRTGDVRKLTSDEARTIQRDYRPNIRFVPVLDVAHTNSQSIWVRGFTSLDAEDLSSSTVFLRGPSGQLPHELDTKSKVASDLKGRDYIMSAGMSSELTNARHYIWYVRDHQLMVRTIVEMPLADYEAYVRNVVQSRAMELAKMAAVVFNVYSIDKEDKLPTSSEWRDVLAPYLKDKSMLDRVTYLGNGEKTTEIENISNTLMGYVDTPYGRATFAWDSTTRWVPRP
jgi:hypothetical protein